jgi:hypothetical protein
MKRQLLLMASFLLLGGIIFAQDEQVIADFDGTPEVIVMNAISGCVASVAANPSKSGINTSDSVGMFEFEVSHEEWAGIWVSRKTADDADSTTAWIDADSYRFIHVMVYKDVISNLKFKLEGSYTGTVEKYATNPENGTNSAVNTWEDIVIDFEEVDGFVPIWLVSPNWDDPNRTTEASVAYIDNIVFNNDPNPRIATGVPSVMDNSTVVYPNPFKKELHVKNTAGLGQIVVSNVLGVQVLQLKVTGNEVAIPFNNLTKGVYFITTTDKYGVSSTSRIVKE